MPSKNERRSLAVLSPIPPAKSGVADYTADLLPALANHYDLTVIDTTPEVLRNGNNAQQFHPRYGEQLRDLSWFMENAAAFDRILYQLGNSGFHCGMQKALERFPGVVVLHDFYLGHYLWWEQEFEQSKVAFEAFHREHGLFALASATHDSEAAILKYPVNRATFIHSKAVVVHSTYAKSLAEKWHGTQVLDKTQVVPFVEPLAENTSRSSARTRLGLQPDDFVVCSFGYISAAKMSLQILKAWAASDLARLPDCKLIFVGESHSVDYGQQMLSAIQTLPNPAQVTMTGFAPPAQFRDYLASADMGVQLRQNSRGETSGAVMDAMSHGLPQIVNANGAFAELDGEAVLLLPDHFESSALVQALNQLYRDDNKRQRMSAAAKRCIREKHSPERCAAVYHEVIEAAYRHTCLAKPQVKRLFLDVTATHHTRLKSGIERVALAVCRELMKLEPDGWVVTPVYLEAQDGHWVYREASDLIGELLDIPDSLRTELPVEPNDGDTLLTLDLATNFLHSASQQGLFVRLRARGVKQLGIVYDLLPIRSPEFFPPGTDLRHEEWLRVICEYDGALCISAHVANDLKSWRNDNGYGERDFSIGQFLLGSDIGTFNQRSGRFKSTRLPPLKELVNPARPTFLMVGTIEPRKGYLEALDAFELLWDMGYDLRLVIVGREGWRGLTHDERGNIPHTVFRLRTHPEKYHRLIWISNADDRKLQEAYEQADCLIAASYDEGFGLPIVEANRQGLAVIARDIPVFHEVAPEGTQFFKAGELASIVANWKKPAHPPENEHAITWRESAEQVLRWLRESTSKLD